MIARLRDAVRTRLVDVALELLDALGVLEPDEPDWDRE